MERHSVTYSYETSALSQLYLEKEGEPFCPKGISNLEPTSLFSHPRAAFLVVCRVLLFQGWGPPRNPYAHPVLWLRSVTTWTGSAVLQMTEDP